MMTLTICDLDGTICDDRHRKHLIKDFGPDRWESYHAACHLDAFMNAGCVATFAPTLFFTARPEWTRGLTEVWLANNGLCPRQLYMRPNDDHSSSVALKERFLLEYARTLPFGLMVLRSMRITAYDDRSDVLAMYRKYGIQTVKVSYETNEDEAG